MSKRKPDGGERLPTVARGARSNRGPGDRLPGRGRPRLSNRRPERFYVSLFAQPQREPIRYKRFQGGFVTRANPLRRPSAEMYRIWRYLHDQHAAGWEVATADQILANVYKTSSINATAKASMYRTLRRMKERGAVKAMYGQIGWYEYKGNKSPQRARGWALVETEGGKP